MEEEGIYYFFKQSDGGHQMVVANTPQGHPDVPGASRVVYEDGRGGRRGGGVGGHVGGLILRGLLVTGAEPQDSQHHPDRCGELPMHRISFR
jgi:hypothetical protein